jgi:hypothetical protein
VGEGLALAYEIAPRVAAAFRRNGEPPADRSAAGLAAAQPHLRSPFVGEIDVVNGRIDVTYGRDADPVIATRRLSLTPYETASLSVVWICGNEIPGVGLQPLGFAGGGLQALQVPTTVEARYVPAACR